MRRLHPLLLSTVAALALASRGLAFSGLRPVPSSPGTVTSRNMVNKDDGDGADFCVMVNGMPGPMATAAAEACLRKGLQLAPVAMTGPDVEASTFIVTDTVTGTSSSVRLVPSSDTEELVSAVAGMQTASERLLAIDYTHPSAVNGNAKFYVEQNIPFVMGTTGGDRDELMKDVEGHFCVIAPNMGKQIVAMQAALEDLANKYPSAFEGYQLEVVESHQKTKADTSGTAKAVISSIKTLAGDEKYSNDDIKMIRDEKEALAFGVPEDAMMGHAFHTYTLTSPDGSVSFQLQHNVAGRTVYAEGTADAVKFLAKKMKTEKIPRVFNMINVLEEGALE
jgi:4-hydroxy-tetrahydrodipicolinate reductase